MRYNRSMASTFRIEHTWPVPRTLVLEHHLDPEIHQRANAAITSAERTLESVEKRGDKTVQRFHVKGTKIPAAAKKVLKPEMLEWIEESVWDPSTEKFEWKILPNVMKDKIFASGELFYEAAGEKTRRVVTGRIEIKIPLAGKVIEKVLVDQLKESYDQAAGAEGAFYEEKAQG